MERQFPKNVRQIGNVCDEPKIYIEDYVDTYLSQIRTKAIDAPIAAALAGEITEHEGQAVVYISGAIQMKEIELTGTEVILSDDTKKDLEERRKEFFASQDIVGWCLVETGHPVNLNKGINKFHGKAYSKENSIFIWKDSIENDEIFFAYKYGELMQMGGHYIYYEKNPAMQNYMISTRRQNGVTPSEMVEDRAAKNFRSTIRERAEYKEERHGSRLLYVTSLLLIVVVLAIGVSTMNNYDKMESVQNSLESLSQSVNGPEEEEIFSEEASTGTNERIQPENVQENIEEDLRQDGTEDTEVSAENIPEASASLEQLSDGDFYVVKKGDTLDSISVEVYGSRGQVDAICKMNGLSDGNLIYIGQKLLLP